MKTFFFMGILLSTCLLVHGQELKTKKINSQYFTEIFQVDKTSKQKQGTYFKILNLTKDTLIKGQYLNDSIVGVWTYFDSKNRPYMKYDYSVNSCLWISELRNKPDTFPVRLRNNFDFAKLDRPPLFVGFLKEPELAFENNIKVPIPVMEKGMSLLYMASFVVNKTGDIVEVKTDEIEDSQIRSAVERVFVTNKWKYVPGVLDGKPVDTKLFVVLNIGPRGQEQEIPQKAFLMNINMRYFGITRVVKTKVISTSSSNTFRGDTSGGRITR
jgi:hypothetical protein